MASRSRGASLPLAWTTIFYLLLVFVAPLALVQTVRAEDEQAPLREDLGDGTFPHLNTNHITDPNTTNQSSALISERRIPASE